MIEGLLKGREWLLADGATGTNLFAMGLAAGESPELWNETHPERVRDLHRAFVVAGADIILTNSFGCNRRRLALHGLAERTTSLACTAASHARAVADAAPTKVIVAGSVGPTGDLFAPLGPLSEEEAVAVFAEEIAGLKEGGADLAWIETMSSIEEMRAAATAAARCGMPFTVTASFDTAGKTMMGIAPAAMARAVSSLVPPPHGLGCNCGVGAADLLVSLLAITAERPDFVAIAKANCGIPQVIGGEVHYSGTPDLMAEYARVAVDAGARIVGGCCGTTPEHLAAMAAALAKHRRGMRPDVAMITARLGPLVSPPAAEVQARRTGRRGRE